MRLRPHRQSAAFTLVELLIGMSLSLMLMLAVLSSYTYIGRNLIRLVNQQVLISQGQKTLAYFAQDVRMARGISGTPSSSSLVLILPTSASATTTVTWTYDSTAGTLTRAPASGNTLTLLSYLVSSTGGFAYYDDSGNIFTSATLTAGSYLTSIKQITLNFNAQKGDSFNGTLTPVYQVASARLLIRNQQFLRVMRAHFHSPKGSLILVVMCFVAVLGIGLVSYVALCSRTMQLSNRSVQTGLSKQLAETGLEVALRAFNRNDWSGWTSGGVTVTWSANGTSGKKATIVFPSSKFGQGVTASVKVRFDNNNVNQLASSWNSTTSYQIGNAVSYTDGMWYTCVQANSNQAPGNLSYWVPAPLPWKWASDLTYSVYNMVNYGGVWYRCITSTSGITPAPIPTLPKNWVANTTFSQSDIVLYASVFYRCTATSVSSSTNPSADATNWSTTIYWLPIIGTKPWIAATSYFVDDVVSYNGRQYRCITNNSSSASFASDAADWSSNLTPISLAWSSSAAYSRGSLVHYGGVWYTCAYANSNSTPSSGSVYWTLLPTPPGDTWSGWSNYSVGDYTYHSGWYRCIQAYTSANPSTWTAGYWTAATTKPYVTLGWLPSNPYNFNDVVYINGTWDRWNVAAANSGATFSATNWENALSTSFAWSSTANYNLNDVVYRSGSFYRCTLAHSNQGPPNTSYWSTDPLVQPTWDSSRSYSQYDTVSYNGSWYLSLQNSNLANNPGSASSSYWAVAPRSISAWDTTVNYPIDNFVSYGGAWYRCIKDNSGQTPTSTTYWVSMSGPAYQWGATTAYAAGAYVNYGGAWYNCVSGNTGQSPNNTTYWTASWKQSWQSNSTDQAGAPVVYSEGTITYADGSTSKTQLRARLAPAPLFSNALAATGTLTISGAGTIDSFDASSSDGYNSGSGSTVGYSAVLASNYSAGTAITISSTDVKGYLAAPSAATTPYAPLFSSGGTVKGASSSVGTSIDLSHISRSPYIPQFDTLPSGGLAAAFTASNFAKGTLLPTGGGTTVLNSTTNIGTPGAPTPSRYYYNSNLSLTGSGTLNIVGPVIVYCNGNLRTNVGTLPAPLFNINTTGSAEFHTNGAVREDAGSGGFYNQTLDPKKLVVISDVSNTTTAYLGATAHDFYGVVYSPNTTTVLGLNVLTGVKVYGALSASEITFSSEATVHYDTSLRYASISGVDQPYAITEWRELTDATDLATMP